MSKCLPLKKVCSASFSFYLLNCSGITRQHWFQKHPILYNISKQQRGLQDSVTIVNIISVQTYNLTVTWLRWIAVSVPQRCMSTHSTNPYKGLLKNNKQFRFVLQHSSSLLSPRATSLAAVSPTSSRRKLTPNVSSSGRPASPSDGVEGTATQKHRAGVSGCEWELTPNSCGLVPHPSTANISTEPNGFINVLWQISLLLENITLCFPHLCVPVCKILKIRVLLIHYVKYLMNAKSFDIGLKVPPF